MGYDDDVVARLRAMAGDELAGANDGAVEERLPSCGLDWAYGRATWCDDGLDPRRQVASAAGTGQLPISAWSSIRRLEWLLCPGVPVRITDQVTW